MAKSLQCLVWSLNKTSSTKTIDISTGTFPPKTNNMEEGSKDIAKPILGVRAEEFKSSLKLMIVV